MQIELIGCTSAGKSNLAKRILQATRQNSDAPITSYDYVLKWAKLNWIKKHAMRMLFLNLIALTACVLTWRKNDAFYRFVIGVIHRLPHEVSLVDKLRIVRIAARNAGIHEIVKRYKSERQVILADEGTLQIANYLFVHGSIEPDMGDLDTFLRLVSLPDVAVYVKQPASELIARTKVRGHKRIPGGDPDLVAKFVEHSLIVFDKLAAFSGIENRLLVVNNGTSCQTARGALNDPRLDFARSIIDIGIDPLKRQHPQTHLDVSQLHMETN